MTRSNTDRAALSGPAKTSRRETRLRWILLSALVAMLLPSEVYTQASSDGQRSSPVVAEVRQDAEWFGDFPSRAVGQPGHDEAIDALRWRIEAVEGVQVWAQEFPVVAPQTIEASLTLETGPLPGRHRVYPLWPASARLNTTPAEGIDGGLVYIGSAKFDEIPARSLRGQIAVMEMTNGEGWTNAGAFGARAILFLGSKSETRFDMRSHELLIPLNLPRFYLPEGELADALRNREVTRGRLYSKGAWREVTATNLYALAPSRDPGAGRKAIMVAVQADSMCMIPERSPGADTAVDVAVALAMLRQFAEFPPEHPFLFAFIDSFAINMRGMRFMLAALAAPPSSRQDAAREDMKRLEEYRRFAEVAERLRDDPAAVFKLHRQEFRSLHAFIKDEASQSVLQIENVVMPLRLRLYEADELKPAEAESIQDEIDALSLKRAQFNTARKRMLKGPKKALMAQVAQRFGGSEPAESQLQDFISDELMGHATELWRRALERIDGQVADVEAQLARVAMRDQLQAEICRALNLPKGDDVPLSFVFGIELSDAGIVAGPNTAGRFHHNQGGSHMDQFIGWLAKTDWEAMDADVTGDVSCAVSTETWTTSDSKNSYIVDEMPMFTSTVVSFGLPHASWATLDGYRAKVDTPQDRPDRLQWDRLAPQIDLTAAILKRLANDPSFDPQAEVGARWRTVVGKLVAQAPGEPVARLPQKGYLASLNVGPAAVQAGRYIPRWYLCGGVGIRRQEFAFSGWDGAFFVRDLPTNMWWVVGQRSIQAHLPAEDGSIVSTIDLNSIGSETNFNTRLGSTIGAELAPLSATVFPCKEMNAYQLFDPRFLTVMDGISIMDARRGNLPKRLNFGMTYGLVSCLTEPFVRWQIILRMGITTNRILLLNLQEDIIESTASVRDAAIGFGMDEPLPRIPAHQAAHDMFLLDKRRLKDYRQAGIRSEAIEDIHRRTEKLLAQADKAIERDDGGALFYAATGALANEVRAYKAIRHLGNDVVRAVVFLLLALVPFSLAMERLLFASPHPYRQLACTAAIFLAMTAALWSFHPAFRITSQPLIIVMAFGIIFMGFLVVMVVVLKFKANMEEMKSDRAESSGARTSRMGLASTAIRLGLANMRKRRLRTALTGVTIVLITFAMLCFTSTSTYVGQKDMRLKLKEGKPAPYTGVLLRQPSQRAMQRHITGYLENILENMTSEGSESGLPLGIDPAEDVAYRYWWIKNFEYDNWRLHVKNPLTCRQVSMCAALGLSGTESAFTEVAKVLPNWERFAELERGFTETQRGGCYLAEDVAADLGAAPGDTLMVAGFALEVVGAYDPDALEELVDLDGRPLLPVDYGAMPTSQRSIKMSGNTLLRSTTSHTALMASEVQSGAGMTLEEDLPYESASRTIVLPALLLGKMDPTGDTSLRSMAVRTDTIEAARALASEAGHRFAFPSFYGSPDEGVQILVLVPFLPHSPRSLAILMIIAGLIIFNTMMSSIADRKKEIYIYTSMGLAPLHIGVLFLAEAVTYGLMGSIFGYIAGQGLATFLSFMGWMDTASLNYSGTHAIATMAVVVAITIVSSLIPAYLAGRLAVPSNKMRWAVPPPVDGVIEDKLPFTVTGKTANGIILYLYDYFDAHRDGTIGCFLTDRLDFFYREDEPALTGLSGTVSLAPYDMGVLQDFEITVRPTDTEDILEIDIALRHQAGQTAIWTRLNRTFLGELRGQLLGWRNLRAGRVLRYISDAKERLTAVTTGG